MSRHLRSWKSDELYGAARTGEAAISNGTAKRIQRIVDSTKYGWLRDGTGSRRYYSVVSVCLGADESRQLRPLVLAQVRAEVEQRLQDRVALEVGVAAVEVDGSARRQAALFLAVEHETDAPAVLLDLLLAVAALRLATRRTLGAVDAREAALRRVAPCRALECRGVGHIRRSLREPLEHGLGTLVRRAHRVEPQRGLALGERIRDLL